MSITADSLKTMKAMLDEPIDKSKLADIRNVTVNTNLPHKERILDFIAQVKNPYMFLYKDKVVRITYEDTDVTFEERMRDYLEMQ